MTSYHYQNLDLPEELSKILEEDFWILDECGGNMLKAFREPVKFEASTWIMVRRGSARCDINLVSYEVKAPCMVLIRGTQILTPVEISEDFMASAIIMSRRFRENLFMFISNSPLNALMSRHPIVPVPHEVNDDFLNLVPRLRAVLSDKDNPFAPQSLLFTMGAFVFGSLAKCYVPFMDELVSRQGRMSDQFLQLVQEHFREQRFLEFYANVLEVTPKHLSRTVKAQTGFTAVEWIERFVILEAKVLLRSSNLNIQQIAAELNFPSQSFFGKYFKKITGMSPKEFRNA